jgi:hypothetical protein
MKKINLSHKGITSIIGLNIPEDVKELDLSKNSLTSLKGIERFVDLEKLIIYDNKIKSLVGIEKLVKLKYLNITLNKIKSLARITTLVNLERLGIANNKINSLAGIEKLVKLTEFNININPLYSIDKYNLKKYIESEPHAVPHLQNFKNAWVLIYNYWQVKKYPIHLKQLIFDYYKMYFINQYKNKLIKNKWIKKVYSTTSGWIDTTPDNCNVAIGLITSYGNLYEYENVRLSVRDLMRYKQV